MLSSRRDPCQIHRLIRSECRVPDDILRSVRTRNHSLVVVDRHTRARDDGLDDALAVSTLSNTVGVECINGLLEGVSAGEEAVSQE